VLAPHLTPDNHPHLIDAARRKSKREVEHLVATFPPQPSVPSLPRKLPSATGERRGADVATSPVSQPVTPLPAAVTSLEPVLTPPKTKPALIQPLAAERFKVQFTVTGTTYEKLRRVQDLMRHTCPNRDVGIVFERALTLLLEYLEKIKLARVSRPQRPRGTTSGSRHIPAAVRRAVWMRDNGQCAFIGTRGRCTERGFSRCTAWCRLQMAAGPSSTTCSCDVERTTNTNRTAGSAWGVHSSCVSIATIRGGSRLGPDRVASPGESWPAHGVPPGVDVGDMRHWERSCRAAHVQHPLSDAMSSASSRPSPFQSREPLEREHHEGHPVETLDYTNSERQLS
jgi:hypothetical protein